MRLLTIFFTVIGLLILFACTKDVGVNPDLIKKQSSASACDSVTFTKHIKPIFNNNCVGCHYTGNTGTPGDFTSDTDIKSSADAGLIKARVIDQLPSVMPMGGPSLPQAELDLIKCWLAAGAPLN